MHDQNALLNYAQVDVIFNNSVTCYFHGYTSIQDNFIFQFCMRSNPTPAHSFCLYANKNILFRKCIIIRVIKHNYTSDR